MLRLPYQQHGSLYDAVNRCGYLSHSATKHVMKQALSVLADLHAQGIVHRDVKMENIVIDDNYDIKFIDFGMA